MLFIYGLLFLSTTLRFHMALMTLTPSVNLHHQILYSDFLSVCLQFSKAKIIFPLFPKLLIYKNHKPKVKQRLLCRPQSTDSVLVPRTQIIFGSVLFVSQYKTEKYSLFIV